MASSVFQRLYDSEINFEVSCFFDLGFAVRLGDRLHGYVAETNLKRWDEVELWLEEKARRLYPESRFAQLG